MKIISTIINHFSEEYGYPNLFDIMEELIKLRNLLYERRFLTKLIKSYDKTWIESQVIAALGAKTIGQMAQTIDENNYNNFDMYTSDPIEIYCNAYCEIAKYTEEYDEAHYSCNISDINEEFSKITHEDYCVVQYVSDELNYDGIEALQYIRENFDAVMEKYTEEMEDE